MRLQFRTVESRGAMKIAVRSLRLCSSACEMSCSLKVSSALVASSKMKHSGSASRARAMARRWRWLGAGVALKFLEIPLDAFDAATGTHHHVDAQRSRGQQQRGDHAVPLPKQGQGANTETMAPGSDIVACWQNCMKARSGEPNK